MATPDQPISTAHFDIILADGFVLTEVAACADVIRIANRLCLDPPFSWSYHSTGGGPVQSLSDATIATTPVPDRPTANYAFVIGNSSPDHPDPNLVSTVRRYTARGTRVVLLAEAASRYIRETGADDHSTHWENTATLRERPGLFQARDTIATDSGAVITCAGMLATVDITLALAGQHVSSATIMTVADILLHDHIRDFGTLQPFSGAASTATGDAVLDECIEIMQANIEDPLPIQELVRVLNVSTRSLERKFRSYLGPSPAAYYKEIRLRRANNLLLNTSLSIRDVGLASGFPNGFSTLYKGFFGLTPLEMRKRKLGRAS